ncbi:MAG: ATP-binding protein [Treponema sp.]|jgi:AAA+ ATPase superfamily predicted ATPase|nr:ATP-binding protein [Treponema sp.]
MFAGREKELEELENLYKTKTYQMVIIYGRRRIGKSTLINQFIHDKRSILFTATETDSRRNLESFSQLVMKLKDVKGAAFSGWEQAFNEIAALSKEPLILVIDEYPYLAQAEKGISSILQKYCDTAFKNNPIMIILCGSSMSFMEYQVLGYQSPIYGRRTAQMKIEPFNYWDSALFVPRYSITDKALVHGITGGIPKYLELFDETLSVKQNIIKLFLSTAGFLYEEPSNLLKQELREPIKYNMIIEAIAKGASRLNEIATKTGLETSAASNYISSLISLGIIRKETAITEEKNKKKTLYALLDTMFVFWYRYILGNEFAIQTFDAESLYIHEIEPDLNHFMGKIFEAMCIDYLSVLNIRKNSCLPFKIRQIGRWWGTNSATKSEEEIDIIGINEKLSSAVFCECKFRKDLMDIQTLDALLFKTQRWHYNNKHYILFSKSGFTKRLQGAAQKAGNVRLVSLKEMYVEYSKLCVPGEVTVYSS